MDQGCIVTLVITHTVTQMVQKFCNFEQKKNSTKRQNTETAKNFYANLKICLTLNY